MIFSSKIAFKIASAHDRGNWKVWDRLLVRKQCIITPKQPYGAPKLIYKKSNSGIKKPSLSIPVNRYWTAKDRTPRIRKFNFDPKFQL